MPGFVDVTGWTTEEVRRLGHADDYDEPEKYQPRRAGRTRATPVSNRYLVDSVWAAAVAAHRINNGYVKETVYSFDSDSQMSVVEKRRNRDIMFEMLDNAIQLSAEDIAQGQRCRQFLQNDITFRALKSKLTDFDSAVGRVLAVESEFDTAKHKLELAVVASLPASHERAMARQTTQDRVRETTGEYVAPVGDKVTLDVEIVRSNYSQQWNTWYVTGITSDNRAVFFAYRAQLAPGNNLKIQGTVKAHRDNLTQLNRVKVMND